MFMKKLLCAGSVLCLVACGACNNEADDPIINVGNRTSAPITTADMTQNTSDVTPSPETTFTVDATPTNNPNDPAITSAPTPVPDLPSGQVLWLDTMPTDLYGLTQTEAEAWFSDAVFIGDSIMLGWKNYNNNMLASNPAFFGETHFLCEGSYGAANALVPISDTSLHPMYMGEQRLLWDSVALMEANKVFICFGLNDIAVYGVDGTVTNFTTIVNNILAARPEAQIYIISAMYMYEGSEMKTLNNTNIRLLNDGLRSLCETRGFKFVDIASHLVNERGYLLPEYSSDNYVHQTTAAYNIWAEILRSLAAHNIKWGY